MSTNIAFTKSNLIAAENSLELSLKGFELLDKKRNVLIMTMMSFVNRAEKIQVKIDTTFKEAYEALRMANITLGADSVSSIAQTIPLTSHFDILSKSVMGVEIPEIKFERDELGHYYSFYHTNTALDIALRKFQELKYLVYELSEVEDSVYKLAFEVKRTQKRANALQNIQIPKYRDMVKRIQEVLEEKEREEFFRLKVVKRKQEGKKRVRV